MRAIVQFARLVIGSSSNGATTRKAVPLFTGGGPGATLAFNASVPPWLKSLRHRRTVSSRTLNASAMRGLVQPASVSRMARALSASPRSREPASAARAARWYSLADTGDLPLMPHLCESVAIANRTPIRWLSWRKLLRTFDKVVKPLIVFVDNHRPGERLPAKVRIETALIARGFRVLSFSEVDVLVNSPSCTETVVTVIEELVEEVLFEVGHTTSAWKRPDRRQELPGA
jgi:hypothetical protein